MSAATCAVSLAIGRTAGADQLALFAIAFSAVLFAASIHQALVSMPLTLLGAGTSATQQATHLGHLAHWHRRAAWLCLPVVAVAAWWPGHGWLAAISIACIVARAGIELRRRAAYLLEVPGRAVSVALWAQGPVLLVAGVVLIGVGNGRDWALPAAWALGILLAGAVIGCFMTPVPGLASGEPVGSTPAAGRDLLVRHWRLGRWYLVSLLVLWVTNYAFGWYLAARGDLREAGYLHATRTFFGLPLAGLLALDTWFQPRAREAWVSGGAAALRRVAVQQAALATLIAVPCALLLWYRPEQLLSFAFGDGFTPAAPALALTAWCTLLAIPDRLLGLVIAARQAPAATSAGFVVALMVTVWLLPQWVAEGATGCARLLVINAAVMVVVPGAWLALRWRKLA